MAERKAVNKYYPPDWDPRKGSVNKRVGQHPLRDRAKKLGQGILVIRFELPYNIWCGGCGSHVGMGVRYNAEKSKVGNYYSTPIYKFRMKCHLCDNYFEIQTDPKNHDYVILCGARRKEQRWDPVANEQIVPEDKATQKKMAMDAMYKLEHGSDDKVKGKEKVKNLAELESSRLSMKEDYLLNRMARDKFRAEKKILKEIADADKSVLERGGLNIELLDETEEDKNLAGLMKYSVVSSYEDKQIEKRKSIEQRPLFDSTPSSTSSSHDNHESSEETKQRLSETLRLSRKDPFAITKPIKPFATSRSKATNLGIHLKHSKGIKKPIGKYIIRKKAVVNHLKHNPLVSHTVKHKSKETDQPCSSSMQTVDMNRSDLDDKFSNIPSGQMHHHCESNDNKLSTDLKPKSFVSDESVLGNKTSVCSEDISQVHVDTESNRTLQGSNNRYSNCPSSIGNSSSVSNSLNASGLSMLMSSYEEDRDSDSYSSS